MWNSSRYSKIYPDSFHACCKYASSIKSRLLFLTIILFWQYKSFLYAYFNIFFKESRLLSLIVYVDSYNYLNDFKWIVKLLYLHYSCLNIPLPLICNSLKFIRKYLFVWSLSTILLILISSLLIVFIITSENLKASDNDLILRPSKTFMELIFIDQIDFLE